MQTRSVQTRSVILGVVIVMTMVGMASAATFNVTGNLTVNGTGGTASDADVEVKGYSSFSTTPGSALYVTSGNGNAYIQGNLEVGGSTYFPNGIWKSDGNIGIGTTNPSANLTVGNNQFQVNATGDLVKINNVGYSWPSSQGAANTVLTDNGAGGLLWSTPSGGWIRDTSGGLGSRVYLATITDKVGVGDDGSVGKAGYSRERDGSCDLGVTDCRHAG